MLCAMFLKKVCSPLLKLRKDGLRSPLRDALHLEKDKESAACDNLAQVSIVRLQVPLMGQPCPTNGTSVYH